MAWLQIPVQKEVPAYEMQVELERIVYTMRFRFNVRKDRWIMDVASREGTNIITGIPLLAGVDLLGKYLVENMPPGKLIVYDTKQNFESPGFSELGKTVLLLYVESGTV